VSIFVAAASFYCCKNLRPYKYDIHCKLLPDWFINYKTETLQCLCTAYKNILKIYSRPAVSCSILKKEDR
jgi:hypothetical protein